MTKELRIIDELKTGEERIKCRKQVMCNRILKPFVILRSWNSLFTLMWVCAQCRIEVDWFLFIQSMLPLKSLHFRFKLLLQLLVSQLVFIVLFNEYFFVIFSVTILQNKWIITFVFVRNRKGSKISLLFFNFFTDYFDLNL